MWLVGARGVIERGRGERNGGRGGLRGRVGLIRQVAR